MASWWWGCCTLTEEQKYNFKYEDGNKNSPTMIREGGIFTDLKKTKLKKRHHKERDHETKPNNNHGGVRQIIVDSAATQNIIPRSIISSTPLTSATFSAFNSNVSCEWCRGITHFKSSRCSKWVRHHYLSFVADTTSIIRLFARQLDVQIVSSRWHVAVLFQK